MELISVIVLAMALATTTPAAIPMESLIVIVPLGPDPVPRVLTRLLATAGSTADVCAFTSGNPKFVCTLLTALANLGKFNEDIFVICCSATDKALLANAWSGGII
jgi:hypothetical protein